MHLQTHILSGWCFGNLFRLTPRERALCMIAAAWPDLDGAGMVLDLFSRADTWDYFWDYHHKLGHNLLIGVIASIVLALVSRNRLKAGIVYLGLFHLHLLMDYVGSGPGWVIYYLWPFSDTKFKKDWAWELSSWQNYTAAAILLAWTILLIYRKRRTPLEAVMPSLDRQLVQVFRRDCAAPDAQPAPVAADSRNDGDPS